MSSSAQPTPPAGLAHSSCGSRTEPHRDTTRSRQCPRSHAVLGWQLSAHCSAGITAFRPFKNPDRHLLPSPPHRREVGSHARRGSHRDHATVWPQRPESGPGCLLSSRNASQVPSWSPFRPISRGARPLHHHDPFVLREGPRRTPGPASVLASIRTFQSEAGRREDAGDAARREAAARLGENRGHRAPGVLLQEDTARGRRGHKTQSWAFRSRRSWQSPWVNEQLPKVEGPSWGVIASVTSETSAWRWGPQELPAAAGAWAYRAPMGPITAPGRIWGLGHLESAVRARPWVTFLSFGAAPRNASCFRQLPPRLRTSYPTFCSRRTLIHHKPCFSSRDTQAVDAFMLPRVLVQVPKRRRGPPCDSQVSP